MKLFVWLLIGAFILWGIDNFLIDVPASVEKFLSTALIAVFIGAPLWIIKKILERHDAEILEIKLKLRLKKDEIQELG